MVQADAVIYQIIKLGAFVFDADKPRRKHRRHLGIRESVIIAVGISVSFADILTFVALQSDGQHLIAPDLFPLTDTECETAVFYFFVKHIDRYIRNELIKTFFVFCGFLRGQNVAERPEQCPYHDKIGYAVVKYRRTFIPLSAVYMIITVIADFEHVKIKRGDFFHYGKGFFFEITFIARIKVMIIKRKSDLRAAGAVRSVPVSILPRQSHTSV